MTNHGARRFTAVLLNDGLCFKRSTALADC